ncbi:MAG: XdhC family protein, partial [Myxococcota bacterium]
FDALAPDEAAVLGTLVHTEGSTYRRPGARMLVLPDDTWVGLVGGGCLEGDLLERARAVRATGTPQLAVYDATREEDLVWGMGLGCAGRVEVLLERVTPSEPGVLGWLSAWRMRREVGVLASALTQERLGTHLVRHADGRCEALPTSTAEDAALEAALHSAAAGTRAGVNVEGWAIERVAPPPRLAIFGAGPDAAPVARLALGVGWDVAVADPRAAYARSEHFTGCEVACVPVEEGVERLAIDAHSFALVMNHHYLRDRSVLEQLLDSPAPYIGMLGPRKRTEDLLLELQRDGIDIRDADRERIHGPAGLDLGGDGPEAIALSIVSEMLAVHHERSGGWLRERKAPIYERDPA